jgi:hypothetical protein
MTYYFTPRQVIRLSDLISSRSVYGLSVFTPTADRKDFAHRHSSCTGCSPHRQIRLQIPSFNSWGDFFILTLEYRPVSHDT